jgi:CubicO group peptidase (beta-lactamase class C family)
VKIGVFLVILCCFLPAPAQCQSVSATEIDSLVAPLCSADKPGIVVGVFDKGHVRYERACGAADLSNSIPISISTKFEIASMSKQFTAFGILLLAERGKLAIDAPLSNYLDLLQWARRTTLRQLLWHTSGIRDYLDLMDLAGWKPYESVITQDDVLSIMESQTDLNFTPGQAFLYENTSYALMPFVVTKVTGLPFQHFMSDNVFAPLGMSATTFPDSHGEIINGAARGYTQSSQTGSWLSATPIYDEVGDGGLWTNLADLQKWDEMFYSQSKFADLARQMQTSGTLNNGTPTGYGFGLFVGSYDGQIIISHGGVDPGFRAQMLRFPESHLTIVALANRDDAPVEKLTRQIADLFFGSAARKSPANGPVTADEARAALGTFLDPAGRIRTFRYDHDLLTIAGTGDSGLLLSYQSPGTFRAGEATILFSNRSGRRVMVRQEGAASDAFVELPSHFVPTPSRAIVGSYYSSALKVHFAVTERGHSLWLISPRRDPLEMTPLNVATFLTDLGLLVFSPANGRATRMSLSNVRDQNIVFHTDFACSKTQPIYFRAL